MKKFLHGCLFALAIVLTSVIGYCGEVKPNRPELVLPARIYAVPGIETNVYFANIARTINPANFDFDVDSPKGRNDTARWRFTPTAQDIGSFSWTLTVRNDYGPTATAQAQLIVTPLDAAKNKSISWLHIGDSISASGAVSGRVRDWAQKFGPKIKCIGTYTRDGKPLPANVENRHEGRPGWTSGTFLGNRSPFFFEGKIDFRKYLAKENDGKAPDVVTIMLGANSVYGGNDTNRLDIAELAADDAMKLVAMIREVSSETIIGVTFCCPGTDDQDAFGSNYKCATTAWQYKQSRFELDKALIKRIAALKDSRVMIVGNSVNLDTKHNFPSVSEPVNAANAEKVSRASNGLHPRVDGSYQYGDFIYCWMKAVLSDAKTK